LKERAGSLEYINHAGQDLVHKASTAEQSSQRLQADLDNLNARWKTVLSEIDDRHNKFTGATEQYKHLRVTSVTYAIHTSKAAEKPSLYQLLYLEKRWLFLRQFLIVMQG